MDRIVFTYWFATIICIGIFALVAAVIVYAVWTFRVQPDDDTDGPPIHGHTGLEIAWTVVPAILVIAIGVVSAVVLSQNADAGRDPLKVRVFAQQFAWRFVYENDVRSNELVLPVDRGVEFTHGVGGRDPLALDPGDGAEAGRRPGGHDGDRDHADANRTVHAHLHRAVRPRPLDHARARARPLAGGLRGLARAAGPGGAEGGEDEGEGQGEGGGGGSGGSVQELGATTFAQAGCGGCHALAKAGTDAQIGPALDDLTAAADEAGVPVPEFVRSSIVDPDAVIAPDYQPGVMPKDFAQSLSPEELDALVAYLSGEGEGE